MQHHAMHCLACGDVIPLARRIKGYWYCSEVEYRLHAGRRHERALDFRRDLNPMRCSSCRRPIPLSRRILAMSCCSHTCTGNLHLIRGNPAAAMAVNTRDAETSLFGRLTRGGFAALLLAGGLGLGRKFDLASMAASSDRKEHLHQVTLANWMRYTEAGADTRDWAGPGNQATPWRIEDGWMQPLGAVLYRSVPNVVSGSLAFRFSLADDGAARILLGADGSASNLHLIEVASSATDLALRVLRFAGPAHVLIGRAVTLPRQNRTLHDLNVEFNGSAIHAKLNGFLESWSNLNVRPGLVGLQGRAADSFRVYEARISLDA